MVIARRPLLAGYAIWWAALIVAYYGLPGLRAVTWGLLGLSGVAAIVVGVLIHRPARRISWLLLAAANLSFVAGQVSFLVLQRDPAPAAAVPVLRRRALPVDLPAVSRPG